MNYEAMEYCMKVGEREREGVREREKGDWMGG